ncbi:hypothetical protein FQA47_015031, partial [Oryzias melastigma]
TSLRAWNRLRPSRQSSSRRLEPTSRSRKETEGYEKKGGRESRKKEEVKKQNTYIVVTLTSPLMHPLWRV